MIPELKNNNYELFVSTELKSIFVYISTIYPLWIDIINLFRFEIQHGGTVIIILCLQLTNQLKNNYLWILYEINVIIISAMYVYIIIHFQLLFHVSICKYKYIYRGKIHGFLVGSNKMKGSIDSCWNYFVEWILVELACLN